MSGRSVVVGVAALAAVTAGCTDTHEATSSTALSSPPPTESAAVTSSTLSPTTSVLPSTTTTPPPELIARPYVDPALCGLGAKAVYAPHDTTWVPFAVAAPQTIPLQVFASPADGVAKPFAVLLRLSGTAGDRANDHPVSINEAQVSITSWPNGNQAAVWTLPDGTWAYLRSRDLSEAALVALITRLTPREAGAQIPGFDLAPSNTPDDLILLHEHLNTGLSGTVTRFQCTTRSEYIYRVDVLEGDPLFVYLGVLDRPRPYAVGVNGSGAITITAGGSSPELTLDDITNADPATWDALPEVGPLGTY